MPRYAYRCIECKEQAVIFHLSDETAPECPNCDKPSLKKLINTFSTTKKKTIKQKVGQVSEEFIKEARKDLTRQKQELDKNR